MLLKGGIPALLVVAVLVIVLVMLQGGEKGPHILLIVADTLRADHLGCYGYEKETSPRIDGLAAQGTLFSRYYTVAPTTLASFTSLLTGLHPKDHHAFRNGFKGDETLPLLGETFQEGGYETAAFVSSYCLSKEFGMARGFDHFDQQFTRNTRLPDNPLSRPAGAVTRSFLDWVKKRGSEDPFFAMVHYFDPHWPHNPPPSFMELFNAQKKPNPHKLPSFRVAQQNLMAHQGQPGEFEENLHNLYCAEIRYMDSEIGKVLDYLEESGLAEDTIVIFTADHGRTFWEHDDYFNHGRFVYDTTIRIPLIIRAWGPDQRAGVSDALLSNLDLGPTLCSLAGVESRSGSQGKSFAECLQPGAGAEGAPPPLFSEATMPYEAEVGAARPNLLKAKCIRQGSWKYITYPFFTEREDQLFNLEVDPRESSDLLGQEEYAAQGKEMKARLDQWARHYRTRTGEAPVMDEATRKELEAIGYGH